MPNNPDFDALVDPIRQHQVGARTESAALLAWFLETIWRLDPAEVEHAICDGGGDKGIDAMTIDEDAEELVVFQSKHRKTPEPTQGDKDLRDLRGAAVYFHEPEGVDHLLASKPCLELRALVNRLGLREWLAEYRGRYTVRLVHVTNALADASATDYLKVSPEGQPTLDLWTRDRLAPVARRTEAPSLLRGPITLPTVAPPLIQGLAGGHRLAVALVQAKDVVALPGIEDLSLFHFNIRLGLGKTRINKDIQNTIRRSEEHSSFPAYHNGLTLITSKFSPQDDRIDLADVSVVNGCQSLLALRDAQGALTDSLRVIVKIIEVGDDKVLAEKITFRSNNQNPVNMRDQRATDAIQRDLQKQVREAFVNKFDYLVRQGEAPQASEWILNDIAAQLILAVWRCEPWNAVRRARLFDADYHRIFSRDIDAFKIRAAYLIDKAVCSARDGLMPSLQASYSSIRFTLCYLLVVAIRQCAVGKAFLEGPQTLLATREDDVLAELRRLAGGVVLSAKYYLEDKAARLADAGDAELFDPKVAFKSKTGVTELERDVVRDMRRDAEKDPQAPFGARWKA